MNPALAIALLRALISVLASLAAQQGWIDADTALILVGAAQAIPAGERNERK